MRPTAGRGRSDRAAVTRGTLTGLGLLVFVLAVASFVVRAAGRFVVGPRTATLIAGPVAVASVALLVVVLGLWGLARLGVISLEDED